MVDDIIEDLIAFNYAKTGKISFTPCAPLEECSACGSVMEESASGAMICPVCCEDESCDDDENDDY